MHAFTFSDQTLASSQVLPFWISKASSPIQMHHACHARKVAYGKHIPEFGESLSVPDSDDHNSEFTVLVAYSKLDGSCIGTVRVQISDGKPLKLEDSYVLPSALKENRVAEISRLAIPVRSNSLTVRLMLIKSAYWFCRFNEVDKAFFCVRYPVDRQYRRFDLEDVLPEGDFVVMKHIGNIPHRILYFDVNSIEARWISNENPLYSIYCEISHPDLLENIQVQTIVNEQTKSLRNYG